MVDTWTYLFKKLNSSVESSVMVVGNEVAELLRENLYDMWYLKNTPTEYNRTYELLNSIKVDNVKKENSGYSIRIFFDNGDLSRGRQLDSPWTQHSSMIDESPFDAGALAWVLDQGVNTPFYDFKGVNYVKATIDGLKEIRGRVEKKMKIKGYDVKVYF